MRGVRIPVKILSAKTIPNVSEDLAQKLGLKPEIRSIGILTTDSDDPTYCALDEATKAAQVQVVYAKSCYAGAANATAKLTGEVIGILAGANPSEVTAGLRAAVEVLEGNIGFVSANEAGDVTYFAHPVSSTGQYLSEQAGIPLGEPLAYLVAPPMESVVGLDAALKAADVTLQSWFSPPTETNYGGGLLTGSQAACTAACHAFAQAVEEAAGKPREV
jgi:ethanolamine utilization protein EutL